MDSRYVPSIACVLTADRGGIAALDESPGTFQKRADSVGIENTRDVRQTYRAMLAQTPDLHGNGCNGVILHPETLMEPTADGVYIADLLNAQGVIPIVKVDEGLALHSSAAGEQWLTNGVHGLGNRLKGYKSRNPGGTKHRVQYAAGNGLPTDDFIDYNSLGLAAFGRISQDHGLVPMLEPEVFADYGDGMHTIDECGDASARVLDRLFEYCKVMGVDLKGAILKTNFVTPGRKAPPAHPDEVADRTLRVLYNTVPPEIAGVAFLSGGLPGATDYLNATCARNWSQGHNLVLTYSFGRELQDAALKRFAERAGPSAVQAAFTTALYNASLAVQGKYR